ncbi:hypothetical protein N431DRAFT_429236 [Stipitochalara longipes BDJ]|nr:hypothetical protein N431DRAFT_429236 [Stipitochalara longipes BDJ]
MMKKPLSKAAFARLALLAISDELKPIRRPLPSDVELYSDSEELSDGSSSPEPIHIKYTHPFYNPDDSDSDMSSGLSPTPSPKNQPARPSLSQPASNNQHTATMPHSTSSALDNEFPSIIPHYTPLRRGFVTRDTDFDALMHFSREGPREEGEESEKRKRGKAKEKAVEREMPEFNCSASTETPLMSWLRRAKEMRLRPDTGDNLGEGAAHSTAGGSTIAGDCGRMSGGHSTSRARTIGVGGKIHSTGGSGTMENGKAGADAEKRPKSLKRAARRTRGAPKRTYTWKDPTTKNKGGKRDPEGKDKGKVEDKGKGREI